MFPKRKQVFKNILRENDMFIVLKDSFDYRLHDYIKENKVKNFIYYPTINTKSGLDTQNPDGLKTLLKKANLIKIYKENEMDAYLSARRRHLDKTKVDAEIEKISNTLRLHIKNPTIKSSKKLTEVRDANKNRTIYIIKPNTLISYVFVKPDSLSMESTKCIIDRNGNLIKEFNTPNDIKKFIKKFKELKEKEVNTLEF